MRYATRMEGIKKSYVREILKVTEQKDFISFAGGLPNPELFPVEQISSVSTKVLLEDGERVLQYSTTEGYLPLREYIVERYYKDMDVTANNILITSGSQQGLDLIGKLSLNKGDSVLIEKPGYLGAIQAFSMFEPCFETIELDENGIDTKKLEEIFIAKNPKLFYAVTNFQNPSGLSYSGECRKKIAKLLEKYETYMIDDNPYGELRFEGNEEVSMKSIGKDKVIALGSFSKIFAPAMRLGWICASDEIIEGLVTLKQSSDLHTNYFSQRILYQYLMDYDIDEHITKICKAYSEKKDCMIRALKKYMPSDIKYTEPEGGMFLWVTLPNKISVHKLLEEVMSKKVAFVPGDPFYVNETEIKTFRLNYTNSSNESIEYGIRIIAESIQKII